jgi:hypothetical protein
MENDADPMHAANSAPRCTAKSKRSGQPCKNPAVRGWSVCRMHGARGGHGSGKSNPAFKHGMRGQEWVEMRKAINDLVRAERELERLIE